MWPVLGLMIVVNVLSVVALALIAFSIGDAPSPFYDQPHRIERASLSVVEATQAGEPVGRIHRLEIPPEYRPVDPTPKPWVVLPDGSIRLTRPD